MVEECDANSETMREFANHIVRSMANENERKKIVESLKDGDALVTMDFSLKWIPLTNIESQTAWFGKKGISFHCSHVLTVRNGEFFQHTFGCVVMDCKQDSSSVSIFIDHFMRILLQNGINRIFFRCDNAAGYHNASLMSSVFTLCAEIGIECAGYYFSETQDGKGAADRQISHGKRKSKDFVNGGGDGSTAAEIVYGLIQPTLLKAYSFYEIEIISSKNGKSTMKGIKSFSTFHFEQSAIRVWRHAGIGPGLSFKKASLNSNEFKYSVRQQGGHLSLSEGFWGYLGKVNEDESEEADEKEEKSFESATGNQALSSEGDRPPLYHCPENSCKAVYLTMLGLENHLQIGKHKVAKVAETITDRAVRIFSSTVETLRVVFQRVPVSLKDLEHSAMNISAGFALYQRERGSGVIDEVAARIEHYFHERRDSGRRADAKEIAKIIRELRNPDTSYTFHLKDCPRQGQAQTIISRLLKEESEGPSKKKESTAKRGGKGSGRGRKRKLSEIESSGSKTKAAGSRTTRAKAASKAPVMISYDERSDSEEEEEEEEILMRDQFEEIMEDIQEEYQEIFL